MVKRWLPLVILTTLIAFSYISGWHEALTLENLQEQKLAFQSYTTDQPVLSAFVFTAAYITAVALSLPIATLLTLLSGFLFGKWLGTFLVVTGATAGAIIIFVIAKTSLGAGLREKAGGIYQKIADNMKENAAGYLLFMRLVPLFPFVLVNIVPAFFNVSLRVFVLTTFFGIIPGTFVYVNLGEALGEIQSLQSLISTKTLVAFALLGLFALIPALYKQLKSGKDKK